MKYFIAVCVLSLFVIGCKGDANAGEISPVQKSGPVQKECPSAVQKSPVQKTECCDCVPVKYRMTLFSRIRVRRAAICEARSVRVAAGCVRVDTPRVSVGVRRGNVGVCAGGVCVGY